MLHEMRLDTVPFDAILYGKKDIEMRLYDEKRRLMCVGDEILFYERNGERTLRVEITALHVFPSFEALYAVFPATRLGYDEHEIPTASPEDMERYYSLYEQKKWGVIGIEIRKKP
ncbi:MAG: RNA-binding protein [Clostridia bacterium]|nr:RNA-binding protein [Clostridia bacterium]